MDDVSRPQQLSMDEFKALGIAILRQAGLAPATAGFSAEIAWQAHRLANQPERAEAMRVLYDLQDSCGHGSGEDAVVDTIMNGGVVPLEDYPVPVEVWRALGFDIYQNGDGSHGIQVPAWLRAGGAGPVH